MEEKKDTQQQQPLTAPPQEAWKSETKPSMKRRMLANDYTARNIYLITLATEGRQPLLGTLEGKAEAAAGSSDAPWVRLSPLGQRVAQEVEHIGRYYPQVRVLGKQVMPDHLHFILFVTEQLSVPLGRVINGFKAGCRREMRALEESGSGDGGSGSNTPQSGEPRNAGAETKGGSGVAWGAALQQAGGSKAGGSAAGGVLWEKGYNDRVLYGEGQLRAMIDYIHDNPRRLLLKRQCPAFFHHGTVSVDGSVLYTFGNMMLLTSARRVAVRCSRRLTEEQLAAACADYLGRGAAGAVLVSPFISPGEKRVLTGALEQGMGVIMVCDNGFAPFFKPAGRLFDACAAGRLLLVSPFEYHTEGRALTRECCNQMNVVAARIATEGHGGSFR